MSMNFICIPKTCLGFFWSSFIFMLYTPKRGALELLFKAGQIFPKKEFLALRLALRIFQISYMAQP